MLMFLYEDRHSIAEYDRPRQCERNGSGAGGQKSATGFRRERIVVVRLVVAGTSGGARIRPKLRKDGTRVSRPDPE